MGFDLNEHLQKTAQREAEQREKVNRAKALDELKGLRCILQNVLKIPDDVLESAPAVQVCGVKAAVKIGAIWFTIDNEHKLFAELRYHVGAAIHVYGASALVGCVGNIETTSQKESPTWRLYEDSILTHSLN